MREIEINGKKYPFIISAHNTEIHMKFLKKITQQDKEEIENSIVVDHYLSMVNRGLRDSRLGLPFWERLKLNLNPNTRIPSKKRLRHIMGLDELMTLINGESLPQESEPKGEVEVEKKH